MNKIKEKPGINKKNRNRIKNVTRIGVLAAMASVIMLFELPLPFAPSFYELDLSETVILMGGFAMGPIAGAVIELLKNLLNILLNGTSTSYVGELANFITGCTLVVPASLIYKYNKTFKGAIIGLVVGVISLTICGSALNYFWLIPQFSILYGIPIDGIVGMGTQINPLIGDLKALVMLAVAPFNLVKGLSCSLLSLLLYKRVSRLLHN